MPGVWAKCLQEATSTQLSLPWTRTHATMQRRYGKFLWLSPIGVLYFLTLRVTPVMLHPQCLDFKPPFRPMRELEFCIIYKEFGCCDYQKDQELMSKYYQIMDNFDYFGYSNCAGFVLELLCQVGMWTKVAWHSPKRHAPVVWPNSNTLKLKWVLVLYKIPGKK